TVLKWENHLLGSIDLVFLKRPSIVNFKAANQSFNNQVKFPFSISFSNQVVPSIVVPYFGVSQNSRNVSEG
ncbi:MAG: hypothetical protein AAFU03_03985, partial [Bacteroidota bacterium]